MFKVLVVVAAVFAIGCQKKKDPNEPSGRRINLDPVEYANLLTADNDTLLARAAVSQLGDCQLVIDDYPPLGTNCNGQKIYNITLPDAEVYYPGMTHVPQDFCEADVAVQLRQALKDGVCYTNSAPLTVLRGR